MLCALRFFSYSIITAVKEDFTHNPLLYKGLPPLYEGSLLLWHHLFLDRHASW